MLPDGSTVAIPAWASEDTMSQVVSYMSATNKVDQKFVKLIDSLGGDLGKMQRAVSSLTASTIKNNNQDDKVQKSTETFADKSIKSAKQITKISKFFGNAETPLSSLKDAASSAWSSIKDTKFSGDFVSKMVGDNERLGKLVKAGGAAVDVGMDAALAYAGWNAAKYEQFAKAQSSAIDLGILLNDGAAAYDDLRFDAIAGGITYNNLLETAGKYSDAMFGLGNTMGSGSQQFADMFQKLNTAADAYGDLGMSSAEMVEAYGEYLTYARRTGILRKNMNASAEEINQEFINLQFETGAIASLTTLTRTEAMRARTQSLNLYGEAALQKLEQGGFTEQAAVAREISSNLSLAGTKSPTMNKLLNSFQEALLMYADNPDNFSMRAIIDQSDQVAMDSVLEGFIDTLEDSVRTGAMSADEIQNYIFDSIENSNTSALNFAASSQNAQAVAVKDLQAESVAVSRAMGNLADRERVKQEESRIQRSMTEAGNVTKNLNDMTITFLELQETMTMNLSTTDEAFNFLIDALKTGKDAFTSILDTLKSDSDGFGGIQTESSYVSPRPNRFLGTNEGDWGSYVGSQNEWDSKYGSTHNPDGTVKSDNSGRFSGDAQRTAASVDGQRGLDIQTDDGNNDARDKLLADLVTKVEPLTVEDFAGFTQISNVPRAVEQLNSLTPEMRRRVAGAMVDFDKAYSGTDTKLLLSEGYRSNERSAALRASGIQAAGAGNSWHNYGMAIDVLGVQNGNVIQNNNSGFYKGTNSKLEEIMAQHGLHNNQGAGDTGHFQPIETNRRVDTSLKSGSNPAEYLNNWHTVNQSNTASTSRQSTDSNRSSQTGASASAQTSSNNSLEKLYTDEDAKYVEEIKAENDLLGGGPIRGDAITNLTDGQRAYAIEKGYMRPKARLFGGAVSANMPYIVGDQLGLKTAELFVPDTSGNIVNNKELRNVISSTLTNTTNAANIDSIDLSSLISVKEETLSAANELRSALKSMIRNSKSRVSTDITNSR